MGGHTAEDIKKSVRTYMVVFAALAALTVVTVAVSYLEAETHLAVGLALVIATCQGLAGGDVLHAPHRRAQGDLLDPDPDGRVLRRSLMVIPFGTVSDTTGTG